MFLCGAVVQPGLGRQIVNLEVAGSNPVGPATFSSAYHIVEPHGSKLVGLAWLA